MSEFFDVPIFIIRTNDLLSLEIWNYRRISQRIRQQASTGPSLRHIQRSKLAKGLQSVKVLANWGPFDEKKILKKVSQMPKKTERGNPLGFSNNHSVAKLQKN